MAKNKKIISFEQLFQSEEKTNIPKYGSLHYLTVILVYFGIMLILGSLMISLFSNYEKFIVNYSETEMLVSNVKNDYHSLAIVNKDKFSQLENQDGVKNIYSYEDYYIIAYENNEDANEFILDDEIFLNIFNNTITHWDTNNIINIYIEKSEILPNFFHLNNYYEVSEAAGLSNFANALSNFVIYIFLLPPLLFLIRKDFVSDYFSIKERKNEWLVIILVGYLYLIIGNVISNFLTNALSDLLKVSAGTAQNQQIIVDALHSKGALLMILSAVILGPIVEEIVFRKAIFGIFKKDYLALIVSTLVFGLIHVVAEGSLVNMIVNGITYFIMGLAFGLIYMKNDKNIYVSIAVHILSNLIAVIGVLFFL